MVLSRVLCVRANDAVAVHSTQDYDILSMFLAPGYTCVGGLAEVCGSELDWDQGKECLNWIASFQYPVLGHELYHNLGLDHTGYDPEANGVCDLTYLGEVRAKSWELALAHVL